MTPNQTFHSSWRDILDQNTVNMLLAWVHCNKNQKRELLQARMKDLVAQYLSQTQQKK